ncbi:MAG: hypothetical protein ACYC65_04735 [Candidatus Limnocylindrales bacterium]
MDPVVAFVGLYRIAGSLFVLRWPFWGALVAVACDLCDLLLFNVFIAYAGWSGFAGYQAFDKWADQVYLAVFLVVAVRDFAPLEKWVAVALWLFRLVGFIAFELGAVPREALILFPNLFEFWFIAVAFTMRFRPSFAWTPVRASGVLALLLAGKLVQEWALHVGRVFDDMSFLGVLGSIWDAVTAPFRGR